MQGLHKWNVTLSLDGNAPINVKPEGGVGGAFEFEWNVHPQGGDCDHLIFQL